MGSAVNTARIGAGDSVAVVGCGGVGLNVVQGARLAGADRVVAVDLNPAKLDVAREFRRHRTVDAGYVAYSCYSYGMARTRVSTTVDDSLLATARRLRAGVNDATLLDEALTSLIARERAGEIDAAYRAYDQMPVDEPDEWGDLASFGAAAGSS